MGNTAENITMYKLATGIRGLDALFYGGIQPHSNSNSGSSDSNSDGSKNNSDSAKNNRNGLVIVITGERGVGKTKFAMQLMHGLSQSPKNTPQKAIFYSLNKDKEELERVYYNMLIIQRIEEFIDGYISGKKDVSENSFIGGIIDNTKGRVVEIVGPHKNNNEGFDSPIQLQCSGNNGAKEEKVPEVNVSELIANRIVYYNPRTRTFHIEQGSDTNKELYGSMSNDEMRKLLCTSSQPTQDSEIYLAELDDCISQKKDKEGNLTYQYPQNSTAKLQNIIDTLSLQERHVDKKKPCIVIDGISDISDNNLRMQPFTHIEQTLRKVAEFSILVFDERYKDIKCNADIVIEMRSKEAGVEEYTYNELKISKSVFQTAAIGWHQYKCRDNGIEVYPSLHRVLQKRDFLHQISLTTHNSILYESYKSYLDRCKMEQDRCKMEQSKATKLGDYYGNRDGVQQTLMQEVLGQDKGLANWLQDILFHEVKKELERWESHTYSTAIIGNPHTYKRTLLNAKIFNAACHQKHTLVLLFDKDLNTALKQVVCPGFSYNETSNTEDEKKKKIEKCKKCYKDYIHPFPIRMGCISAEELFAVLERQIDVKFSDGKRIEHIVVDDLQKIDYCFPFIKSNSLFLSALITFCREKNIELTILCDKKSSLVQELYSLADNVICTKREKDDIEGVTFYIEKNVYSSSSSIIKEYRINDMSKLFCCNNGHIDIAGDGKDIYVPSDIGSMKDYWRKAESVYVRNSHTDSEN